MVCEHLAPLETALLESGARETTRGQVWTDNCREWIYFDVVLDTAALRRRFALAACVDVHENTDPRSGVERGLVCTAGHDGVMGLLEGRPVFR
jgi:hypothetical protein